MMHLYVLLLAAIKCVITFLEANRMMRGSIDDKIDAHVKKEEEIELKNYYLLSTKII